MKFDFIAAENAVGAFDIEFMCTQLGVSRSGYYDHLARGVSQHTKTDHELVLLIRAAFAMHRRGCGSRMVQGTLATQGHAVSRKRVVRLMAEDGLRCRLKRRFVHTTQVKRSNPVASNVLKRRFTAGRPNRVWASDITYFPTKHGWAYLAVVVDLGSRRVVGWHVSASLDESGVLRALENAFRDRRPPPGLIHHSDRGVQYTARAHRALLARYGAICSMSRKGNCWDNACVESFFSTLKRELPNDELFENWRALDQAVFAYINAYYNTRRPHSALGYLSPMAYEKRQLRAS